ncbi:DNA recombination protein RmuC [Ferrimonas pelagia]|uniref:DNA recombination protein RmuC n=1 Tax=Ferrimonas pelagia TaxID=1177826 RepID=A0ABP9F3R7_9GAMM
MTDAFWITSAIAAILGLLCLYLISHLSHLRHALTFAERQHTQQSEQLEQLNSKLSAKEQEQNRLHAGLAQLRTQEQHLRAQLTQQQDSEARLTEQFENLANRIFEQKQQSFLSQSHKDLDAVLSPIKMQMEQFRQQVQTSYTEEAKQRHALAQQLLDLKALNQQMSEDAVNLTKALKGDNKAQGNWGEVILARLLEQSGLKQGREYETQASFQQADGKRYQPDVLIRLPDGKDVIIDAKMSLRAFERFHNSEDPAERSQALAEHVGSVRNHIKELGSKDYHKLEGLQSLDYVLMFIPVEPAFLTAVEADPALINDALEHNILLVSPTNLLVALRTIQNLWRFEHQNQNARHIAQQAGKLYDKMVGFADDLQKLGRALETANGSYQQAMNKFSNGRGNLLRQGEQLRQLGVESSKQPDPALLKAALEQDN